MVQSAERLSGHASWGTLRAVTVAAGLALGSWLLSSPGENDSNRVDAAQSARHGAAVLESKIRNGQPVSYEANRGVEWAGHKPNGNPVLETTILALEYDPDGNPGNGDEQYFRLVGNGMRTLQVRRIPEPINLVPQHWDLQHPDVTVTSGEGVVSTGNLTGIPGTTIHLSSGEDRYAAVGQTSANP